MMGPLKREGALALLFVAFALGMRGNELLHDVGRWVGAEVDWGMVGYLGAAVASLVIPGLALLAVVWLIAKVWKAA